MIMTETKKYKVLIPTAGIGSRLDNLTKYLNKSLVSVQNKPIIARIIEMFPKETEFVIALGYKGDLVKQFLSLAYPEKNFYFSTVEKYDGEGSGLGLTILSCEKFLQEPFIFCSCDTIVTEEIPYPDKNIVGYDHRDNKTEYRTIDIVDDNAIDLLEKKDEKQNSEPYIGLACIKDYKVFWEYMHKGKDESILIGESYPLSVFAKNGLLKAKKFTWFDCGNKKELEKTQEYFKQKDAPNILPKENEAIWFIDDKVIKYSDNKNFIKDRIERAKYLQKFVPQIISHTENMYAYEKEEGIVLSQIESIELFEKLLEYSTKLWIKTELSKEDENNFHQTCKEFYYDKTLERIKLYYKTFDTKDKETVINGIKMPTLENILSRIDWNNLYNGLAGKFHGDFHFENILYNEKADKFIFLDWRQNFGSSLDTGDIYYDLAKLLHGLIICHELIAKNKYAVEIKENIINYSFERKEILIKCEKYFYKWLKKHNYDVKKVKILTAIIYLNISALHHYPYCHLLYNLGKRMLFEEAN